MRNCWEYAEFLEDPNREIGISTAQHNTSGEWNKISRLNFLLCDHKWRFKRHEVNVNLMNPYVEAWLNLLAKNNNKSIEICWNRPVQRLSVECLHYTLKLILFKRSTQRDSRAASAGVDDDLDGWESAWINTVLTLMRFHRNKRESKLLNWAKLIV